MDRFSTLQVCKNGHIITDRHETGEIHKQHCDECGELTITQCPHCNKDIQGAQYVVTSSNYLTKKEWYGPDKTEIPPKHCHVCGKPYPWTERQLAKQQETGENNFSPIDIILNSLGRFHLITKPLRDRQHKRDPFKIENEYDVQDLLHAILKIHFDDIRPEEWTPSYAGSAARMDFLIKEIQLVIEVKKTRDTLKDKEVGEQLIIDIKKYAQHPDCKILICFVYDPDGLIRNPAAIERDLSGEREGLNVMVLIVPKGI